MTTPSTTQAERAREVATVIERLRKAAIASSDIQRQIAEAKSLRQPDNPDGLIDLYSWPTPEQTSEGHAARLLAFAEQSRPTDRIAVVEEAAEPSRYHLTNAQPVQITTDKGIVLAGEGWLLITETEYTALSKEHNHVEG